MSLSAAKVIIYKLINKNLCITKWDIDKAPEHQNIEPFFLMIPCDNSPDKYISVRLRVTHYDCHEMNIKNEEEQEWMYKVGSKSRELHLQLEMNPMV